jgi:hypothetical protein
MMLLGWYRRRHADRGLPAGETGAVAVIQRANGDLRLNPHVHAIFLDGVYAADREGARGAGRGRCGPEVPAGGDGRGLMFHPALAPSQDDIETLAGRVSKRILRFLQRRKVITLVTAPGDGEVTVVGDETMGEQDPLLARLLAAATVGAVPASKRKPLRIVLDPDERPVGKGTLCAQAHGFNVHAATKVAANDQQGRLALCRYVLRPPLANDRLKILDDNHVRIQLKKPWSDGEGRGAAAWGRGRAGRPKSRRGTSSVDLEALAFIARLAALVPSPRRHLTRYFGVLSSHASSGSEVVPAPAAPALSDDKGMPASKSKYIPWAELLRKTFGFEIVCQKCQSPLRLIALIKNEDIAKKILVAMHLPAEVPRLHPARPPPQEAEGGGDDWPN